MPKSQMLLLTWLAHTVWIPKSRPRVSPQLQEAGHWLKTCPSQLWLRRLSSRTFKAATSAKMTRTPLHGEKVPTWLTFTAEHLRPNAAVFALHPWPISNRQQDSALPWYSLQYITAVGFTAWLLSPNTCSSGNEKWYAICHLPFLLLQHARTQDPGCNVTTMEHHGDIWELPLGICIQPEPVPWHLLSGRTKISSPGKCLWLGITLL